MLHNIVQLYNAALSLMIHIATCKYMQICCVYKKIGLPPSAVQPMYHAGIPSKICRAEENPSREGGGVYEGAGRNKGTRSLPRVTGRIQSKEKSLSQVF